MDDLEFQEIMLAVSAGTTDEIALIRYTLLIRLLAGLAEPYGWDALRRAARALQAIPPLPNMGVALDLATSRGEV